MVEKVLSEMNFGILTTLDHPLLPYYLFEIGKQDLKNVFIICDSKIRSKKSNDIWIQRTHSNFNERYPEESEVYKYFPEFNFFFVDNHNSQIALNLYKENNINCFLNAGTPRKIGTELIKKSGLGVVNVHPGELPKYRGACAVEWAIINDDQICNTAHFMNEEYDAGPIIEIEKYTFEKKDSYTDIRSHVFISGVKLSINILKIAQKTGMIYSAEQDQAQSEYYKPIDNLQLSEIEQKIKDGKFRFQK